MKDKITKILFIVYTLFEIVLGIMLLFYDFKDTNIIRYTFIITNFVFVLINLIINKKKDILLTCFALAFTCIADYGLIILGDNLELSVAFFTISQIFYMLLIGANKLSFALRMLLIVIMEVLSIIVCKELYSLLVAITMIYISIFIVNIFYSFYNKKTLLLSIGLILFILCDICVGISSFTELFTNKELVEFCGKAIFYFYLPSQYLISIHSLDINKLFLGGE